MNEEFCMNMQPNPQFFDPLHVDEAKTSRIPSFPAILLLLFQLIVLFPQQQKPIFEENGMAIISRCFRQGACNVERRLQFSIPTTPSGCFANLWMQLFLWQMLTSRSFPSFRSMCCSTSSWNMENHSLTSPTLFSLPRDVQWHCNCWVLAHTISFFPQNSVSNHFFFFVILKGSLSADFIALQEVTPTFRDELLAQPW
jgi:hypothetical protein